MFWFPRVQDAARAFSYSLVLLQDPSDIGASSEFIPRRIPLTEPLEGPDAKLIKHLTESRPALIIVDLNSETIPWARWIQVIKTSAATRRIPILAFGPHVEKENLGRAEAAGADVVLSRGKFQNTLVEMIEKWARPSTLNELRSACDGELSEKAIKGIQLHNTRNFYEAHEELELAWMEVSEHEGYLYRALLQTTVAYLHLERGNLRGAAKMLLRVRQWLDPLPDTCRGVDIQDLRKIVDQLRSTVDKASSKEELPPMDELYQPFRIEN
jgi:predicted metal-dependent hydrolase/CheY-like chemotaxis protein